MAKKKTKAELLQEAVAEAVGAGRELHLESVDFSDPNRPKTCLEVDFPILPINHVAAIEGNAGKPIYQMSKWWARRRSSVFRSMLIAAATKAPDDPAEAAKTVWDAYYANHQKNEAFRKLKVADIFMGGGTTIVEGSRLGMEMYGNDLNPVAWLVVKNELAQVDPDEVQALLDEIEAEVKPQIMPYYACDCPRGHKGKWTLKATGEVMGDDFDPLSLSPEQRPEYEYEGPEFIYTFWVKHGPCQATECDHRTPIMSTPVFASKSLTVRAWTSKKCKSCGEKFDIEQREARMAPTAMLVVAETEKPYTIMDEAGRYSCPHCGEENQDQKAATDGQSASLGKAKNKKIDFSLLVHPDWLKGASGKSENGTPFGGSVSDDAASTAAWNEERAKSLQHVEIRGKLPESITIGSKPYATGKDGGTTPKEKKFQCNSSSCGLTQDIVVSVERTKKSAPLSPFAVQGNCPACKSEGDPYGGRFYSVPQVESIVAAARQWELNRDSCLTKYWPRSVIPDGYMSPIQNDLPAHGMPNFSDLFNPRQLLLLTQLYKSIIDSNRKDQTTKEFVLGAFQQYLRNQSMLSFWHRSRDHFAPALSNCNYHPKTTSIEVGAFCPVGYGPWHSACGSLSDASRWIANPWELIPKALLPEGELFQKLSTKSAKVYPQDAVLNGATLTCSSSSELIDYDDESLDLVITDPPFGGLMQYAEVADFFHVWLRLGMMEKYPDVFASEYTPKVLEAVANKARNPSDSDRFYQRVLTQCWSEACRILKPSGILSFTFHHSEDEPWVAVLESLFEAGFYLEAAYPIRSDETKGDGQFGSKMVEFDIIHVCRKRLKEPEPISWARLRRQIMRDVRQLQEIIEQHQQEGLGEADLQVIRRGKALEYFSRHYGKVYIEKGREDEFTVKDALVGINQLLDDESDTTSEAPPVLAEPYTRQFLRLFADKSTLERDQLQKYLRGTGVSPSEFLERGWCSETKKIFTITDPLEWAQQWKGKPRKGMSRDFDQTYFLIGACYDDSGIKASDTLNSGSFVAHPAISDLLTWFGKHGSDSDMRAAARRAKQIYSTWLAKNTKQETTQRTLFDLEDE